MNKQEFKKSFLELLLILVSILSLYLVSCFIAKLMGVYHIEYWYSLNYGEITGELIIFSILIVLVGIVLFAWELFQKHKQKQNN